MEREQGREGEQRGRGGLECFKKLISWPCLENVGRTVLVPAGLIW